MDISGVRYRCSQNCRLMLIDVMTDDLKNIIREQLTGIFWGSMEEIEIGYSYEETLREFLIRYDPKPEDTKKGMIGELLAHVLINCYCEDFSSISVMRNIEERSIKKGFDILYFSSPSNTLWYSEVKSGAKNGNDSTSQNSILYWRAHNGIDEMFNSGRVSLWDLALVEAKLAVEDGANIVPIRKLIKDDRDLVHSGYSGDVSKHVILVSMLYSELDDEIDFNRLEQLYIESIEKKNFDDIIIISIQKQAYETIVNFLRSEIL